MCRYSMLIDGIDRVGGNSSCIQPGMVIYKFRNTDLTTNSNDNNNTTTTTNSNNNNNSNNSNGSTKQKKQIIVIVVSVAPVKTLVIPIKLSHPQQIQKIIPILKKIV